MSAQIKCLFPLMVIAFGLQMNSLPRSNFDNQYEKDGIIISAGFAPDKAEIILGQPLFLTYTVINKSDKLFSFWVGGDIRGSVRHNNFRITAYNKNGKQVKDPYSYNHFGGPCWTVELKKDESYTERLFLNHWCEFESSGIYKVTCERILNSGHQSPKHPVILTSSTFQVKVKPYDKDRMGAIIQEIGSKMDNQQSIYETALSFSILHDARTIPYLVKALSNGDFQNKLPAIRGLSQYPNSTEVYSGIIIALKDKDHAVRDAAGDAWRKMKQPDQPLIYFLNGLKHESSTMKIEAIQALAALKSHDAFDPILYAIQDSDLKVRQTAVEGLGKLGFPKAIEHLEKLMRSDDLGVRIGAAKGLHALNEPIRPHLLTPVIKAAKNVNDQNFHEAIRLIRMYGGENAAQALVSCLHFQDPSPKNSFNMFLLLAIEHTEGGPKYYYKYHHNPNSDGTPEELAENRRILSEIKLWLKQKD